MAPKAVRRLASLSPEELAAALDSSNALVRTLDGEILYWSSGNEKVYGWSEQEALGCLSHALLRTRFPEPLLAIKASLLSLGQWSGNLMHHAKDSRTLNVLSHWILVPGGPPSAPRVTELNIVSVGLQSQLALLVDSANDAVIGHNLDGIVTSWNHSAEKLFEYSAAEMIGNSISRLHPNLTASEEPSLIARIIGGETVTHYETIRVAKSGRLLNVSLTPSPIYDFSGRLVGISKIARDITDRCRGEEALRRANASLQEFAYAAAHDLQEPLRNISLSLQEFALASSEPSAEARDELIALAIRNTNRMHALVKDLLSFSRSLDSPGISIPITDAAEVVAGAMENLFHAIEESHARIIVQSPLPKVRMHRSHLLQLMQNIIGNSLKYGIPGVPPVIRISAETQLAQVVFSICDNGCGIDSLHHQRIFGVFKRLDSSKPGNGIGLAVCKRIVEHYSGRIWVVSEEGQGATFFFSIPSTRIEVSNS
jgi:PAS domain S-box-containing protein